MTTYELELYYDDLTPEAQARLLDTVGIKSPTEMNWDVFPITVISFEEEEEDEGEV